jgi:hypothetical protein
VPKVDTPRTDGIVTNEIPNRISAFGTIMHETIIHPITDGIVTNQIPNRISAFHVSALVNAEPNSK